MPTWACLLRGVNLGNSRKLPMAQLRQALAAAVLADVRTFLQSGNVVVTAPLESRAEVSGLVGRVISAEFGLDVPVITRTPSEIEHVISGNPFSAEAADRPRLIRVIFLAAGPPPDRIARLEAVGAVRDKCRVIGNHVYVDYVDGYHNTGRTAPFFTRVLGVDGTERNWRTVLAIAELCRRSATRSTTA
jgi:uncharacterized protein (DUF1697 family)